MTTEHREERTSDLRPHVRKTDVVLAKIQLVMGLVACQYAHYELHGSVETIVQGHIAEMLGDIEGELQSLRFAVWQEDVPF